MPHTLGGGVKRANSSKKLYSTKRKSGSFTHISDICVNANRLKDKYSIGFVSHF